MTLSRQRAFVTPEPGEDWNALALRALPGEPVESAVAKLKSWNLHLFVRVPPGSFFGSDVIFVEPPCEGREEADERRPTRSEAKPSEGRQPERERSASAKARQVGG